MKNKRILIFRYDNIGDMVLFSGALRYLRQLYPGSRITIAVQQHLINLVELCPYIDECISVAGLTWWEKLKKSRRGFLVSSKWLVHICNRLWNRFFGAFDVVICPVRSTYASPLETLYCLGAKKTIGISGCSVNSGQESLPAKLLPQNLFSHYLDISGKDPWLHEFILTLDFLRFLGCPIAEIGDIQPQFWLSAADINHLAAEKEAGEQLIGLFPGAAHQWRCWHPDNYGELAKLVRGTPSFVIFGNETDRELVRQIESVMRNSRSDVRIIDLSGKTTLRELVKTIAACDLFIGMETSGLHLAIAAGVPTIGIIGGGHYGRFVPWGDAESNVFLTKEMGCFHCNWVCSAKDYTCIQGITPVDVARATNEILSND